MRISFHEELEQLEAALQEEGALVLRVLRSALNALARGDDELADEVIGFDDEIDRRYVRIEEGVQSLLARQTPVADRPPARARGAARQPPPRADGRLLRDGREADEADGRPRRERRAILSSLEDMGQRAEQMIRVALDAFAERDLEKAQSLHELDELIDRANRRAVEDVLSLGDSLDEREYGLRMLVVSRCVERIGDHAVDIGEQIAYLVTGDFRELTDASHRA